MNEKKYRYIISVSRMPNREKDPTAKPSRLSMHLFSDKNLDLEMVQLIEHIVKKFK
jgi:hypothetical protein